MIISEFGIEFSYHLFLIYDSDVDLPGNEWTETNSNQGFARRDSSVNFGTLFQFGYAQVQVFKDDYLFNKDDERVIKVPFYSPSGKVFIEGPEENEKHSVIIEPGHYLLTAAQQARDDDESLFIRVFFCKVEIPAMRSEILIKDEQLNPPHELSETSGIASF